MQKNLKQHKPKIVNQWKKKDLNLTKVTKDYYDIGGNMIMLDQ